MPPLKLGPAGPVAPDGPSLEQDANNDVMQMAAAGIRCILRIRVVLFMTLLDEQRNVRFKEYENIL